MSRKHVIRAVQIVTDGDMSSDITSTELNVEQLDNASVHVSWTSSSIDGTLTAEAKNGSDGSWYELDFNVTIPVDTDNDFHQLVFRQLPFTHLRLKYTANSGTGALNAVATLKTEGA